MSACCCRLCQAQLHPHYSWALAHLKGRCGSQRWWYLLQLAARDMGWWGGLQSGTGRAFLPLNCCLLAAPPHPPAGDEGWWEKHKIWIGESNPPGVEASYSELLASSVFFFSLMGDGFSSRFDDAVIHG